MSGRGGWLVNAIFVATILSLFIVCATFILAPSGAIIKALLSATSVVLVYPAAYTVGKRSKKKRAENMVAGDCQNNQANKDR